MSKSLVHCSVKALEVIRQPEDRWMFSDDLSACAWERLPPKSEEHHYMDVNAYNEIQSGYAPCVVTCSQCLVLKDLAWELVGSGL